MLQDVGFVVQDTGAIKVVVFWQEVEDEKAAVTEQVAPLEIKPVKEYDNGLTKGAVKTCEPPQAVATTNEPVVGALVNEIEPVILYVLVDVLQIDGVAVKVVILQVLFNTMLQSVEPAPAEPVLV